jgi:hypothetical protein
MVLVNALGKPAEATTFGDFADVFYTHMLCHYGYIMDRVQE